MAGADVASWRAVETVVGKAADSRAHGLGEFVEKIDLGVFGLCNCGGCTMQTVSDALVARERGIPTVVVTTEAFRPLAESIATMEGHAGLALLEFPFPLEGLPENDVRSIARERFAVLVDAMGVVA